MSNVDFSELEPTDFCHDDMRKMYLEHHRALVEIDPESLANPNPAWGLYWPHGVIGHLISGSRSQREAEIVGCLFIMYFCRGNCVQEALYIAHAKLQGILDEEDYTKKSLEFAKDEWIRQIEEETIWWFDEEYDNRRKSYFLLKEVDL